MELFIWLKGFIYLVIWILSYIEKDLFTSPNAFIQIIEIESFTY